MISKLKVKCQNLDHVKQFHTYVRKLDNIEIVLEAVYIFQVLGYEKGSLPCSHIVIFTTF